jgi:carbonic anhydrase
MCLMWTRLNVYAALGLAEGESHVIRNAGGVVTEDVVRSLAIGQRLLGATEIILVHHTDCGMMTFIDDASKQSIQDDTGLRPARAAGSFPDVDTDVQQPLARIRPARSSCTRTRSADSRSTSPRAS